MSRALVEGFGRARAGLGLRPRLGSDSIVDMTASGGLTIVQTSGAWCSCSGLVGEMLIDLIQRHVDVDQGDDDSCAMEGRHRKFAIRDREDSSLRRRVWQ